MGQLDRYFFKYLPPYFKNEDTYKADESSPGFLERFLDAFQAEFELYVDDIDNAWEIIFPTETDEKFLNYIGDFYGSPPDTFGDTAVYRKLLRNIIYLLKWKGTEFGVRKFFQLFGADAELTVIFPEGYKYDQTGVKYDGTGVHYDGQCHPCVTVNINVVDPTNLISGLSSPPYSDNEKRAIQTVLKYLYPINAQLGTFKYNGTTQDYTLPNADPVR